MGSTMNFRFIHITELIISRVSFNHDCKLWYGKFHLTVFICTEIATIYDEFHNIFYPHSTDCFSNKYLLNDSHIKWTTIKCFVPFMFVVWVFPQTKLGKSFYFLSPSKAQQRFMEMFPHMKMMFCVAKESKIYFTCFSVWAPKISSPAWQNALCLSFSIFINILMKNFLILQIEMFLGKSWKTNKNCFMLIHEFSLDNFTWCFLSSFTSLTCTKAFENMQKLLLKALSLSRHHLACITDKIISQTHSCGVCSTVQTE